MYQAPQAAPYYADHNQQYAPGPVPGQFGYPVAAAAQPAPPANEVKLFVGNLSASTTQESLGYYFAQFGPLVSAKVVMDPNTGESKRFGFVSFYDQETANLALSSSSHNIDGRDCNVSLATGTPKKRSEYPQKRRMDYSYAPPYGGMMGYQAPAPLPVGNKIFIAKIPENCSEEDLRDAFSLFGPIIPQDAHGVKIVCDLDTGKPKGFGFVTFRHSVSAAKAATVGEVYLVDNEFPSPVKIASSTRKSNSNQSE
eukprot:TRINITY_DN406_c0_g1_i1.p1 TRINITY_DN406_c0_g1~~TRINITY_DN406_c0_g1_i1.p1  ORF type:complete len:292 (-),score=94.75 TRINITY_DN406_c0_g1_i1:160-921(-)